MKDYKGKLTKSELKKDPIVLAAYYSFNCQKTRCGSKKHIAYKHYGAIGIKVNYSLREFINWYLKELNGRDVKNLVCSRKDHTKDYSLDNIKLETRVENSSESSTRCNRRTKIKIELQGKELFFNSLREATKETKISNTVLRNSLLGKNSNKYDLRTTKV